MKRVIEESSAGEELFENDLAMINLDESKMHSILNYYIDNSVIPSICRFLYPALEEKEESVLLLKIIQKRFKGLQMLAQG